MKALAITKEIETPGLSNKVANIHFHIGNTYMCLNNLKKEDPALEHFLRAKKIIENILFNELNMNYIKNMIE